MGLRWTGRDALAPEARAALLGPGAPFELVTETVLGAELEVFARRPRSLRQSLDAAVGRFGDLPFLVADDRQWTFADVAAAADAVGAVLVDRYGVGPGDRVGIVAANCPEYAVVAWAAVSVGAVVAGLNGWWTGPELEHGIGLVEPTVVVGDAARLDRIPEHLRGTVPCVELADLVAGAALGAVPARPAVDEDDPAIILFTSGTTGRPKGATLSHRNLLHFGMVNALNGALRSGGAPSAPPSMLVASPMFHISGLVGFCINGPFFGAKLVFLPPGRWDEERHLRVTEEQGITSWSGVPAQFWRLLDHPRFGEHDVSSVRTIGAGGAPFPPELVRRFHEQMPGATLANGYGMSETAGLGTSAAGPVFDAYPASVGVASPTSQAEVRDELGNPVPDGVVGEIHLRNASVFLGYWSNPEATAEVLDADRWYRTGDYGRIEDGVLFLESRRRDLILRGGENVYPIEIEHRLVEHPDVVDVAVVGVDHPVLGQEVKAFVVARPGSTLDADGVRAWAAEALAAFKVPAHVEFRAELPYTDTGKVLKSELEREEQEARAGG